MVTKIQPPAERIMNTLVYNELKMSGPEGVLSDDELQSYEDTENTGHIIATRNVPETSSLENEFSRLRLLNKKNSKGRKLTNPGFHMSVNPSDSEMNTDESTMAKFIDDLMDKLGYGNVPYRIYKHTDIERTHYHVIATRIGQDGKKINDSYENRRCNTITEELCQKYGFQLGREENELATDLSENMTTPHLMDEAAKKAPESTIITKDKEKYSIEGDALKMTANAGIVLPFKYELGNIDQQLKNIHEDAMKWAFSTPEQYVAILKYRYNTSAEIKGEYLSYQGLDVNGEPAHSPRPEIELKLNSMAEVIAKCTSAQMKKKTNQRKRISKTAKECAEQAKTWNEFKKMMSKKGIYTVISWNENDEPFGITWLDRATKCAFKGSETEATIVWLKETAEKKGWNIRRDRRYEKKQQGEKMIKATARLRRASTKQGLSMLANIKAVGHTHGTTTSATYNKDRLKKEGEEEKNDIII